MKRVFVALPLAILLTNCSTQRNTTNNDSMGSTTTGSSAVMETNLANTNPSGDTAGGSSTQGASGRMSNTTGWNQINSPYIQGGTAGNTYNPNNYMQNPDKYKTPAQLGAAGGWTYNTDWRINTNFKPEAVGQWKLEVTPEVASLWRRDTSRPETYAAYWTPEAVNARQMAEMAMNAKRADSLAMLTATGEGNLGTNISAGKNANKKGTKSSNNANKNIGAKLDSHTGIANSGNDKPGNRNLSGNPRNNVNNDMNGTTGTLINGTNSSTEVGNNGNSTNNGNWNGMDSANTIDVYTAVNGNRYMMPRLSLFLENGTFSGFTGCNNISGKVMVNGNQLKFENIMPATNLGCTGGFDQEAFLERLRRADSYEVSGDKLHIKQGGDILFTLSKDGNQNAMQGSMK